MRLDENVLKDLCCPLREGIPNIIIVIPTYNEAKNIHILIENFFSLYNNFSILIVDDNSPDGTSLEVKKNQKKYSNLYLIKRNKKLGLGGAYIEGFRFCLDKGYDVIIQMDADLSHSPKYIFKMIQKLKDFDLVVGSRYVKKGGVLNWPLNRIILSRGGNIFAKKLLGININDLTSGFKCFRSKMLENIDFSDIRCKGYGFQIEMVYRVFLKGFNIFEYPIVFKGRKKETSKMSIGIAFEAFIRIGQLFFQRIINFSKKF